MRTDQPGQPGQPGQPNDPFGPDTPLDPAVEARVRALLASASIEPMPQAVENRVLRALAAERRQGDGRVPAIPRRDGQADDDVLTSLLRQRQRPRPLLAVAAVAAAAAVVAVGGSALHLSQRPSGSAAAVVASAPTARASTPTSPTSPTMGRPGSGSNVHIQLSRTAYGASSIAGRARELLTSPGMPLREGAAESPSLGPIATEIGLASCLAALGEREPDAVAADLATYEGEQAAIIVVTRDGSSTAYAVRRHCTTGNAQVLRGATPVP